MEEAKFEGENVSIKIKSGKKFLKLKWFFLYALILIVLGVVFILYSYSIKPPMLNYEEVSEKILRSYLEEGDTEAQMSAAILLAMQGDQKAVDIILDKISEYSSSRRREVLYILEDAKVKFSTPEQVEEVLLMGRTYYNLALGFIPEGREKEYNLQLVRMSNYFLYGKYYHLLWVVIEKLDAAGDEETLWKLHIKFLVEFHPPKDSVPKELGYTKARLWAFVLFCLNKNKLYEGFKSIEKEIPEPYRPELRKYYTIYLVEKGLYSSALDVYFDTSIDEGLKELILKEMAKRMNEIPLDQINRLDESECDYLLLEYARFCESRGDSITREVFERLLKDSKGAIQRSVKMRMDAGDKDLKELIIEQAKTVEDYRRAYDIAYTLKYWFGGIPQEVKDCLRAFAYLPSESKEELNWKNRIIALLLDDMPKSVRKYKWGKQYSEYKIPWNLRRNRINTAINDLRELKTACNAYYVDWSRYPSDIRRLTTPVAFIKEIRPDVCASQGTYSYTNIYFRFSISSTGPDGVYDVYLPHFNLYYVFKQDPTLQRRLFFYVVPTPEGYEFKDMYVAGSDIIFTYH